MRIILTGLARAAAVAFVVAVLVAAVAGCGNDAPVQSRDRSGATLLNMPNKFDTIATKCDGHGHRIYATQNHGSKSSALAVVADGRCTQVGP